jgi:short-subunit dehydrogenase
LRETEGEAIGLLVAAAGFGSSGAFADLSVETELNMVDVNCRAVVALASAFANRFKARGGGGFVLMSSLLAFQGVSYSATYAATKAFVQSFAEGLRGELAPLGIDVLAVAPGPVATGFGARAGMNMSLAARPASVANAALGALGRQTTSVPGWFSQLLDWSLLPLPRWGKTAILTRIMRNMAG